MPFSMMWSIIWAWTKWSNLDCFTQASAPMFFIGRLIKLKIIQSPVGFNLLDSQTFSQLNASVEQVFGLSNGRLPMPKKLSLRLIDRTDTYHSRVIVKQLPRANPNTPLAFTACIHHSHPAHGLSGCIDDTHRHRLLRPRSLIHTGVACCRYRGLRSGSGHRKNSQPLNQLDQRLKLPANWLIYGSLDSSIAQSVERAAVNR